MSVHIPVNDLLIEDRSQLLEYILQGCKPKSSWAIGTEHEKFAWSIHDRKRPSYHGPQGIEALFHALMQKGWQAHREESYIIALTRQGASITLEPGGQLELSGAPLKSLELMSMEVDEHIQEVNECAAALGIIFSGLGSEATLPQNTPKMPKSRYDIMRDYLPTRGTLALHMMHNTSTVQCNLDFSSAEDAMQKLRVSLYLQPIVMAMFANSFVLDEKLRPGDCARSTIWLQTDNDRYLYPSSFLDANTDLMTYVNWVLEVPMFFIARDGKYLDCSGLSFIDFMNHGAHGTQATIGDFGLHLSTIFPDARLKQYLEVRGADMSSIAYCKALSAFHVGLLYDQYNLDHLSTLFTEVTAEQLWQARAQVDLLGLKTMLANRSIQQWAEILLDLAYEGLDRYEPTSSKLLDPLMDNIEHKKTPADLNRVLWSDNYHEFMQACKL